jgi:hypothetical protein
LTYLSNLDRTFERADTAPVDDTGLAQLSGQATLDGVPFTARWLGAIVVRDGIVTPCNLGLTGIVNGAFEVTVASDTDITGCGVPGADVVLWTYIGDQRLFTAAPLSWQPGHTEQLTARFESLRPLGAAPTTTEFGGEVYLGDTRAGTGLRIEARIDGTLCGVTSTRGDGTFIIAVVDTTSVPGCQTDTPIVFTVDGQPTNEGAVNGQPIGGALDLTVN